VSVTKACAVCGKAFTPRTSAKYCSDECKRVAKARCDHNRYFADVEASRARRNEERRRRTPPWAPEPRTCDVCGSEFVPTNYWQKRCSPECMRQGNLRTAREWYARRAADGATKELRPSPVPSRVLTLQERLRIGALVGAGRVTAWDMARELRMDVADVLRMRDEWRRWRHGVETLREVRA